MKVSLNQSGNVIDYINVSDIKTSHLKNGNYIKYISYNKNSVTIENIENGYKIIHYNSVSNIENELSTIKQVKSYIKHSINRSKY